ncbi:MAG: homocysteine S-methyltransferase family protein [Desulfuromonadales bacterium]|nr:homocysteine S-methyltransferase family protein [Desulfuromonadales bacterium]
MATYRDCLPQLMDKLFLADGGLETTLIFDEGFELPEFAAFTLLGDAQGESALVRYFRGYAALAREQGLGFILESMTWRASLEWGKKLGCDADALDAANRNAIKLLAELRYEMQTERTPMVISGCMGPRGDGYNVASKMTAAQAQDYHRPQIESFYATEADMVSAFTMNYVEEAVGLTNAARAVGMPVVISFTVETDGRLPSGQALGDAITAVDEQTDSAPVYYMLNCAHPSHFSGALDEKAPWAKRIKGVRANASAKSHAELDEAEALDAGDPIQLADQYRQLLERLPNINVLGGCCGTDLTHLKAICRTCTHQ